MRNVYADATLVFPLLVAQTFAKDFHAAGGSGSGGAAEAAAAEGESK